MVWFTLAMFAVSFLVTALLAPKPKIENVRAQGLDDLRFPTSSEGAPISLVLGRVRIAGPNTLWSGDFKTEAIKEKVKTGLFSSKRVTVGHKYYVGFNQGLCLGGDVHLRKVWIDKKEVWSGDIGPSETAFTIDKPSLFGGEKQGGGFVSTVRFYGGSFTQPRNSYLAAKCDPDVPSYNGVAHVVFEQAYIGEAAQLRPIRFEVSRYTNSLGLTSLVNRIGDDLNPMEVMYQVLTSEWGGLNVSPDDIDAASFSAIAQTLADEGNGMSVIVSRANGGKETIEEILRQIDGILYQDPETGKITASLVRDDYNVEELTVLDESNVVAVRNFSRTSWEDTLNQVRVTYPRRDNKYETGAALAQDMANINSQGRLRSTNASFPFCHIPLLAAQLATRELTQLSVPLYKVTLELSRKVAQLRPGQPFVFSWSDYGVEQVVMRVQRFNLGELVDGRIVIDAVQDRFATNQMVFAAPERTQHDPINRDAADVTQAAVTEAPYWLLQQQVEVAQPEASRCYPMVLARNADAYQQAYSASISDVEAVPYTAYSGTALLDAELNKSAGFTTGSTSMVIREPRPASDWIAAATATEARAGANLLMIGTEWLTFQTVTDNGNGTWTLGTVRRGLLDTQAQTHAALSPVYLVSLDGLSEADFSATSSFTAAVRSYTDQDATVEASAPTFGHTPNRRYERPLPPDWTQLNASRAPGTINTTGPHNVNWRQRSRLNDSIQFTNDAADTEEAGVTYTLRVYVDGAIQSGMTQTGLSSNSTTVTFPSATSGTGRIELVSVRDGLESYTADWIEFTLAT